jgi:mRNA interferase MazF
MVKQYQIYFVNLDPTIGAEVKKIRPCVVVSPNEINSFLKTVIIAPITSTLKSYPTRIDISLQGRNGQIMIAQIRTIDKSRLINQVALLNEKEIEKIKFVIKQMLVD